MTTVDTKRRSFAYPIAGFVLVAILAALFLRSFTRETVEIRVSPVTRENLTSSVPTNGKVEPIEPFQAHASTPGVVERVYVDVGEKVRAGTPLLKLDDTDVVSRISAANATLHTAQANASDQQMGGTQEERNSISSDLSHARLGQQQATQDLAALEALQAKGAASAAEVAAARQRLLSATGALQSAQLRQTGRYSQNDRNRLSVQVADAQQALRAAQADDAKYNIRAPFEGTVYSIPIGTYDFVAAGEDLLDMADLSRLRIRAYFDEPEVGKLAPGQAVKIIWDAKPGQVWHGHIELAPTTIIAYNTRNVGECLITVDDAHGDLSPNANVTVSVTTSQRFNVLSIPREALHTEGNSKFVFRVVNRRLVRTPVQVGVVNLTRVEIISGLTEKDTVALAATTNRDLTNGMQVKTVE